MAHREHRGQVVSVRGSVVDVRFPPPLPTRFQGLRAGVGKTVLITELIHNSASIVLSRKRAS